jgi:autotransporter-associated beta strand protein
MKSNKTIKLIPVLLALAGFMTSIVRGADLFWDANGATAGTGGAGTWTTANTWRDGSATGTLGNWADGNVAQFGGTAGAVTVGTVSVGGMGVTVNSYSFTAGTITFSGGILDVNTIGGASGGATFTCNLAGSVVFKATGNAAAANVSAPPAAINADNTGLTSFELNANAVGNPLSLLHQGALGPNGSTVTVTKGVLSLSAASGTTYNSWVTSFGSGGIRLRVTGTQTYSGNGTLTGNVDFMTIAGATLIYLGTLDIGANTLTLAPTTLGSGAVTLNGAITGSGNLAVNIATVLAAGGDGTVTLGAANPLFTGTATTYQNKGRLTLNHVNALQNATLDTGASGSQSVTFGVAGDNTYNIGALTGSDALAIGANTISVGVKTVDTTFSAVISGSGGKLTKVGANKLTLATSPTYDGLTTVSAGTLALNSGIALATSSSVSIAAGGTFDVSASSTYTLGSGASLTASGTGTGLGSTAAQIKAGVGTTGLDLGSRPVTLNFTPTGFSGDSTHPALYVSSGTLNINSAITVVNNGASPLGNGTYVLIKAANASTTGTPTLSGGSVGGQGLVAGKNALVQRNVSTGDIELTVQDALVSTTTLTRHTGTVNNNTYGDTLQFDISVTGSGATPTGTVELRDGSPSGTLLGSASLSGGAATISPALNALTAGTHTLYAVYSGDPTYQSGSGTLSQTVLALSVTVSGASASSKMFDNTTAATLTSGTVSTVVSGDTSTEINANSGSFANVGPGTGITVTTVLSGTKASSYSLSSPPTFTADILTAATWTATTTPASWNTTANWLNNLVGTGSGNTADFNTVNLPADTTVNLTAPRTIGSLIFGDTDTSSAASWTLANNGSGANTLTLAGGTPTVTVNALGAGKIVTITAAVNGTEGLTKSGVGTLALGTIGNSYSGGTTINQGILQIADNQHLGAIPGSFTAANITLNGGTLSNSATVTLGATRGITLGSSGGAIAFVTGNNSVGGIIAGANPGPLQVTGSGGTMNLQGANTYAGGTTLSGSGTMVVGTVNSVGTVGSITSGPFGTGTLNLNGSQLRALTSAPSDPVVLLNNVALSADTTFPTVAGELGLTFAAPVAISGGSRVITTDVGTTVSGKLLTLSGVISDGGNNYGLTKAGAGTLVLSGANTYGGPTLVNAGALVVTHNTALGNTVGATTVASGAGVALSGGVTVTENFSIAGTGPAVGSGIAATQRGAIQSSSGNNVVSGNITITAASTRIGCQDGASLTISGTITTNGLVSGLILRNGLDTSGSTTTISGTGNAWGDTQIFGGTTRLGVNNGLSPGRLTVGTGSIGSTTFDLNGYHQTLVNLQSAGTAPGITNSSAALATLTLNNTGEDQSYGGYLNGSIALVKDGAFRQTFTAPAAYTGATIINGGTLAFAGSGSMANSPLIGVASGATFDVSGLSSAFTLGTSQALSNTAAGTGILNVGSVGMNTGTGRLGISFNGSPAFAVTNGTLTLLSGTVVNLNNLGPALGSGSYKIISKIAAGTPGTVVGTAPTSVTVGGNGVNGTASLQIVGGELYLNVIGTTTLALSSASPTNGYLDSVTLTAAVQTNSATAGNATGNVTFTYQTNGVPFLTNVVSLTVLADGTATNILTTLPRGTNLITAAYPGDSNYLASSASLNQIVTNHPPTAVDGTYYRAKALSLKFAITNLLAHVTDADGDTIALQSVGSGLTNATITADSTYVYYLPGTGAGSNDNDVVSYTVSDGFGGTATANIFINVYSATGQAQMSIPTNGVVNIKFFGIPNYTYVVQTTTNLSVPWWTLSTNAAGTNGIWQFTDLNATNAQQYYRLAQP